jgi:plasmid maintenance system antidote protein VapI
MATEIRAKLRGQIAEEGLLAYKVAAEAEMHPATLSQLLNGHLPLSDETADRIRAAIQRVGRRERRDR